MRIWAMLLSSVPPLATLKLIAARRHVKQMASPSWCGLLPPLQPCMLRTEETGTPTSILPHLPDCCCHPSCH